MPLLKPDGRGLPSHTAEPSRGVEVEQGGMQLCLRGDSGTGVPSTFADGVSPCSLD